VPLDFVDIKISTNKRKVSEENNQPKEKTIKKTQGIICIKLRYVNKKKD
jgi:hypothetical protein